MATFFWAGAFFGDFLICFVFFSAFLETGFFPGLTAYFALGTDFSLFTAGLVSSTLIDSAGTDFGAGVLVFSDALAFSFSSWSFCRSFCLNSSFSFFCCSLSSFYFLSFSYFSFLAFSLLSLLLWSLSRALFCLYWFFFKSLCFSKACLETPYFFMIFSFYSLRSSLNLITLSLYS